MPRAPKKATARAKTKADEIYNARRRYYRAAQRNLKKAEQSSGATAARYRNLAKQNLDDAMATYDLGITQMFSKPIENIARELGVDIKKRRENLQRLSEQEQGRYRARREKIAGQESKKVLEGSLQDESIRAEYEARALFNSPIGSRILGGLVDVWREPATDKNGKVDKSKIIPAILDYFKVDSLSDVLNKLEKVLGESLYSNPENTDIYENVKIIIQTAVASNAWAA